MNSISVFANLFIDNQERLDTLKLSYNSFKKANIDNWVINIRGQKKIETKNFLLRSIKKRKLKIFFYENENGWFFDSLRISKFLRSHYIFFWVEDHICVGGYKYFNNVINSLFNYKIDYLPYSWFFFGNNIKSFGSQNLYSNKYILYKNYNKIDHEERLQYAYKKKLKYDSYVISACSIIKKNIFIKLLSKKDRVFYKWSNFLPFNFEKDQTDTHWLPYKIGILKKELFAPLDDDLGVKGYSLISRKFFKTISIQAKNTKIEKKKIKRNSIFKLKILVKKLINRIYVLFFYN